MIALRFQWSWAFSLVCEVAPSHVRLRAHDHYYTSSTLIGGKGGASGPSSLLPTTLEGPMEYTSECKMDGKSTWIPTWHRMDRGFIVAWTISWQSSLEGRPNTKIGDNGTLNVIKRWFLFCFIMCEDPHEWKFVEIVFGWGRGHVWLHTTLEGPWSYYMILEGALGQPLDTMLWVVTISWSRLLARV